jgi:hypothetical protein
MTNGSGELERQRFTTYALDRILPEGDVLTLNSEQGVLTHLHQCAIVEQQSLSPSEMYVVMALLDNHPDYAPYEVVLSEITGKSVEKCRARLEAAEEENAVDAVLKPVRNLLARVRLKLHPFGIRVRSMVHEGYVLIPAGKGLRS